MSKISAYAALNAPLPDDVVPVVDIHDTSMAATGTTKTLTLAKLVTGGGGAAALTPTPVKTSAYSAAARDFVPCDTTSGGFTVTLPNAPADLTVVGVKHVIQGGTNAVTVACAGSDVFNKAGGATSGTLTLLAQGMLLQYKAAGGIWYVVADDLALPQLDARFVTQSSLPLPVASGGTGQVTGPAALGALGGAAVAGDIAGTSASPQVTGTHLASPLPLAQGGSGAATQQAAINALSGAQSAGKYLRSDGTNASLAAIQAADVPALNQNTTGTAAGLSAVLAVASGGTGSATRNFALANDPRGYGFCCTGSPYSASSPLNPGSQVIIWVRFAAAGYAISNLAMYIAATSGNMNLGIYSGTGTPSAPGTLLVSTGSIAVPGTGKRVIALGSSVTPALGDFAALVFDNATATVYSHTNNLSALSALGSVPFGYQAVTSALALPATAGSFTGAPTMMPIMFGS